MDWKTLFLDANGRIGKKDFWIGFLILFVAGIILNFVPVIGQIAAILLIYPWICLYSKRLHDFGKSGWLVIVPVVAMIVATIGSIMTMGAAAFGAASSTTDYGAASAMMGGLGGMALLNVVALLVCLAFLLWVGLSKGDEGTNQYGSPRVPPLTGA
ncbi:DUF805 domain-containing protein [Brevundimonas sp.]|uniref:DUF805 domain-containing protein n=1 Tax=Brevundimonas sp. TaxID=1871086 RepID=UPI0025D2C77F|nr:DUF805 domain-containing protein [Brevundimonas sp.]